MRRLSGCVLPAGERSYAIVSVNALAASTSFTREPLAVTYDAETEADRIGRRQARGTPIVPIEG